jgi:hypothetical protein
MYARGLSTRDIEAVFADGDDRSLLNRTAGKARSPSGCGRNTRRLPAAICRNSRSPTVCRRDCRAVAFGPTARGSARRLEDPQRWQEGAVHLAPGTKEDTANCKEFFYDMRRRGVGDRLLVAKRRGARDDPCDPRNACRARFAQLPGKQRCETQSKVPVRTSGRNSRPAPWPVIILGRSQDLNCKQGKFTLAVFPGS